MNTIHLELTPREALAVLDVMLQMRLDLHIDKPAYREVEDKTGEALRKYADAQVKINKGGA
jgi:hypothetical protein